MDTWLVTVTTDEKVKALTAVDAINILMERAPASCSGDVEASASRVTSEDVESNRLRTVPRPVEEYRIG